MTIRVPDLKLPVNAAENLEGEIALLTRKLCKMFHVKRVCSVTIYRKSVDLRKKTEPLFVYTVDMEFENPVKLPINSKITEIIKPAESGLERYIREIQENVGVRNYTKRPIIVGFGPAGMFAGLVLAEAGLRPVIIERGAAVEERIRDVDAFWNQGILKPESNVQFGEGGAGTFSDGKLNTLIREKDTAGRCVLEAFVKFGAPPDILYKSKPHIGTDNLRKIVKNIREYILEKGGEIHFHTKMTGLCFSMDEGQRHISGITVQSVFDGGYTGTIKTDCVFLGIGHSARDTFALLKNNGVAMERKAFSVGARIEHLQEAIDKAQYGISEEILRKRNGPADYKLSHQTSNGRGVYTFCMCPGGSVVGAASEYGGLVTNGMSDYDRAGRNANAAILVSVYPMDFTGEDVLSGVEFQRVLERRAFLLGGSNWKAPCQLLGDFAAGRESYKLGQVNPSFSNGYCLTDLNGLFPTEICTSLKEGIQAFGKKIAGFGQADAVLTGCESRSSSPVRILRDETGCSANMRGLYPIGEGAGYAGGIVSAATDGIKAVEKWADTL